MAPESDRSKSHRAALEDIADAALDDEVPEVAFAAFVYDERTDFTHTAEPDASLQAVIDCLAAHTAALSEATGHSVDEILDVTAEIAKEKERF